jgi:hypothetical protein
MQLIFSGIEQESTPPEYIPIINQISNIDNSYNRDYCFFQKILAHDRNYAFVKFYKNGERLGGDIDIYTKLKNYKLNITDYNAFNNATCKYFD